MIRIMEFNDSKNDSHVTEYCEVVSRNGPEISDILFTKHDRELACEVFLNSIKSKRSPKIMKLVEMS